MTEKDLVNVVNNEYDTDTYQELLKKPSEKWTKREKDYCVYCYHYEEWQAGML